MSADTPLVSQADPNSPDKIAHLADAATDVCTSMTRIGT